MWIVGSIANVRKDRSVNGYGREGTKLTVDSFKEGNQTNGAKCEDKWYVSQFPHLPPKVILLASVLKRNHQDRASFQEN